MIKGIFFANSNVKRYAFFMLFFQMGMAVSLASMPIYFKNENAISVYGVAYSVMALTGAFSFIYGMFVDRIGFVRALLFALLLYATALSMRVVTHPVIAVMTAIMAGIGASTAILANRSWVLQISEHSTQNTTELTAMRSMIANIAMLVGTGLVSLTVYAFGSIYFWLLLLAGGFVFASSFFAYQNIEANKSNKTTIKPKEKISVKNILTLSVVLFILSNLIVGFYVGLFKPYLILMFVEYGASESKSVFIYLMTTVMSIFVNILLLKYNKKFKNIPFVGFFVTMIGCILSFLVMSFGLYYGLGLWVIVLATLARSAFTGLSSSFEEVLEYEFLDKATLAMALGFTQTSFLAGDAIGSLVTSLWIVPKNVENYAQVCLYCAVLAFFHMAIIFLLKLLIKNSIKPTEK